jgi:hypothetical protein
MAQIFGSFSSSTLSTKPCLAGAGWFVLLTSEVECWLSPLCKSRWETNLKSCPGIIDVKVKKFRRR